MSTPVLSEAVGYGVIVGVGFFFAFGMVLITWCLKRYNNESQTSEVFNTAGRTVKSGLVASAVVSSWTWAATLLQSTTIAYRYGVSGPFWYASGACVQVILFATIAIELKKRAPNAHTFLESIRARYGKGTHAVYIVFGLMTNILVTAMLLTGGSAVVQYLTGVPAAAACFLIPTGVVVFTMFGGLKATMLTDYVHCLAILIIIFLFAFTVYATGNELGSPGAVYDALVAAAERNPVAGNEGGSYLTMRSQEGIIFFVINIAGNFGTVFLDNGYYNKAIAASPVHALPGYVAGGLAWFAVPWLCSTTMGLAALALENSPVFPSYPERLAAADVTAGLVLPNAAVALLGSGGAAATLILVFMAVTSSLSSELIAISSIFTYDIYQTYINPTASGRRLKTMSHASVLAFALFMSGFSTGLYYIGIGMGYLYLLMGVIISGAVLPSALNLLWSRQSWAAATFSPPIALACSISAWLATAYTESGELSIDSTGANNPMLAGNVVALCSPLIWVPALSLIFPSGRYDWKSMAAINQVSDDEVSSPGSNPGSESFSFDAEKSAAPTSTNNNAGAISAAQRQHEAETAKLNRSSKVARIITCVLTLSFLILWPMPMFGSRYIFSREFFTGWVVVGFVWLFVSSFVVGVWPVVESLGTIGRTSRAIWRDVTGKGFSRGDGGGAELESDVLVVEGVGKEGESSETPSASASVKGGQVGDKKA